MLCPRRATLNRSASLEPSAQPQDQAPIPRSGFVQVPDPDFEAYVTGGRLRRERKRRECPRR